MVDPIEGGPRPFQTVEGLGPGGAADESASSTMVRPGESRLAQVAHRLNLPEASLREANTGIGPAGEVTAGQELRLPSFPAPDAEAVQAEFPAVNLDNVGEERWQGEMVEARLSALLPRDGSNLVQTNARFEDPLTAQVGTNARFEDPLTAQVGTNARFEDPLTARVGTNARFEDPFTAQVGTNARFEDPLTAQVGTNARFEDPLTAQVGTNARFEDPLTAQVGTNARFEDPLTAQVGTNARFEDPLTARVGTNARFEDPLTARPKVDTNFEDPLTASDSPNRQDKI